MAAAYRDLVRAVFFDLDGTLVDSQEDVLAAFAASFERLKRPLPPRERLLEVIGIRLEDCYMPFLGGDERLCRKAAGYFREYYRGHFLDRTRPYPGIPRALRELSARTSLAVATMKKGRFAREVVRGCGWMGTFRRVIGSEEGYPPKPDPTMLQALCRSLEVPPEQAVYIGDTHLDLQTARAASIRFYFAGWGYGNLDEADSDGLSGVFSDPKELEELPSLAK